MWVRRAAIRPVPPFAELSARTLTEVEDQLSEDDDAARSRLDEAFTRFEETQPVLANRISAALSRPVDETALALGYFLTLAVWLAFDAAFHGEIENVTETALTGVEESLQLDEQLRLADPAEALDSDDVIAMEQPHVMAFIHEHIDAALEANANEVDVDDVHSIYRLVLIEVLALSYAVKAPPMWTAPSAEFTA
ncbi:MAG: hypothetical protein U0441_01885 [Polyangiaceae bacterium]